MQENLLILRKRFGYSQKDLAAKLGISAQQYRYKEKGLYEFTADEMFILKDIFGKSIEEIFLPRGHQYGDKKTE